MKIRACYVSNSSSSSWVCTEFNKEKFMQLIDKYIELITSNKKDMVYYDIHDKVKLKECIMSKFSDDQEELSETYVCYDLIYGYFSDLIDYYSKIREFSYSDCKDDCKEEEEYNVYYLEWLNKNIHDNIKKLNDAEKIFPELKNRETRESVKSFVDTFDIKVNGGNAHIINNWQRISEFLEPLSNEYYNIWKKKHDNYFIFSFASDNGNKEEAYLRYNLNKFIRFMKKNGLNGFWGENS